MESEIQRTYMLERNGASDRSIVSRVGVGFSTDHAVSHTVSQV